MLNPDNFPAYDNLPGALILVEIEGEVIAYMNHMALRLLGVKREELSSGFPAENTFGNKAEYGRARAIAWNYAGHSVENSQPYNTREHQVLHEFFLRKSDSTVFYAECQGSFLLDENQVPVGIWIHIRDLEEQHTLEEERALRELKYRTLVETSSDLIWQVDSELQVISANATAAKVFGMEQDQLEGSNLKDVFPAATFKNVKKFLQPFFKSGEGGVFESTLPGSNQSRWVSTSLTIIQDVGQGNQSILGISRDITAAKHVAESLKKADEQLRMITEKTSDNIAISTFELKPIYLYVNPSVKPILGYEPEELIGKSLFDFIHPDDKQHPLSLLKDYLKVGLKSLLTHGTLPLQQTLVYRFKHKSGEYRVLQSTINIAGGKLLSVTRDITIAHETKIALEASEERFTLAMNASKDGLYDWNLETNTIYYSPGWKRLLGYEDSELSNDLSTWEKLTEPEDAKRSWEMQQDLISGQIDTFEMVFKMRHKDGYWVDILSRANAIFNDSGAAIRIVGTHVDITDQIGVQEQLRDSEERFALAMNAAHDGLYDWNLQSNEVYYSPSWKSMLGYEDHELANNLSSWIDLTHPDDVDRVYKLNQEMITNQYTGIEVNFQMRHKAGHWVDILSRAEVFSNESGVPIRMVGTHTDISSQKQAEKALMASEKQFKDLYNNSPDMYVSVSPEDASIMVCNNTLLERLGYSRTEVVGAPIFKVYHEDCLDLARETFQEFQSGEVIANRELVLKTKTGKKIDVSLNVQSVLDEQGNMLYSTSSWRDITERKAAEARIKKSEERYRLATQASDQGIWDWKTDSDRVYYNSTWKRQLGYQPYELENKFSVWEQLLHPEDKERMLSAFQAFLTTDREFFIEEFRMIHKDGSPRWLHNRAAAVRDDAGKVLRMFGAHTDITERKLVEETLEAQRIYLANVIEGTNAGTWDWDIAADHIEINDRLFEIAGYTSEELGPINYEIWRGWVHPDDLLGVQELAQTHIRGESDHFEAEFRHFHKSGDYTWVVARGKVSQRSPAGEPLRMSGITIDVTNRKRLEVENRQVEAQLQQALKLEAVGTMVGGIAHDFNNILQGMFLYGQVLESELTDNETLLDDLKHLMDGAHRARDLVKQILTFSRKSDVELRPQAIHEIVLDVLSFERASMPAQITIEQAIDMNCPEVLCDKTQIHQIILNLCNNARQAIGDESGTIKVILEKVKTPPEVELTGDTTIKLEVSDTGRGMDKMTLERIFDPFFTTKEIGKGTGLGLSMIHGIVKLMNGYIAVESTPGEGSTFTIFVPIAEEYDHPDELKPLVKPMITGLRVLIVDDESSIRQAGKRILEKWGQRVDTVENGQEAYDLITSKPSSYDLVITDMTMPVMSGLELSSKLKAAQIEIPMILSTGNLGLEEQQEYAELGFSDFLQKPWNADQLVSRIQRVFS